jgi:hypothetical protein
MNMRSKFFGAGLAAVMAFGVLAAPALANAQRRSRTHSEDTSRNNAIALGAAGVILLNNHQKTLGTIALAGAASQVIKMQNDIDNRHDRENRYGYNGRDNRRGNDRSNDRYNRNDDYRYRDNNYGYGNNRNSRDPWGNQPHGIYSDGGWYDSLGAYHKPDPSRRNDNCNDNNRNDRGRDWASTRGNKRGWDKNGKR